MWGRSLAGTWACAALAILWASSPCAAPKEQDAGRPAAARGGPADEGAELYRSYCAACHGGDGRGDGPVASALKSAPSNLTRLAAANRGVFPAQRVAMVVEFGVVVAAHGTTDMPTWGATFRADGDGGLVRRRVRALTRYLESIQIR